MGSGWATCRSFIEKMRTGQRCEGGETTSQTDAGELRQRKQLEAQAGACPVTVLEGERVSQ